MALTFRVDTVAPVAALCPPRPPYGGVEGACVRDMSGKPASEEERRVRTCSVGPTRGICEGHALTFISSAPKKSPNFGVKKAEISRPNQDPRT